MLDCHEADYSKQKFDHFMLKEIHEQPEALKRLVDVYRTNVINNNLSFF